jgi:hypothetical protein
MLPPLTRSSNVTSSIFQSYFFIWNFSDLRYLTEIYNWYLKYFSIFCVIWRNKNQFHIVRFGFYSVISFVTMYVGIYMQ